MMIAKPLVGALNPSYHIQQIRMIPRRALPGQKHSQHYRKAGATTAMDLAGTLRKARKVGDNSMKVPVGASAQSRRQNVRRATSVHWARKMARSKQLARTGKKIKVQSMTASHHSALVGRLLIEVVLAPSLGKDGGKEGLLHLGIQTPQKKLLSGQKDLSLKCMHPIIPKCRRHHPLHLMSIPGRVVVAPLCGQRGDMPWIIELKKIAPSFLEPKTLHQIPVA
jgi:hypothetical protein